MQNRRGILAILAAAGVQTNAAAQPPRPDTLPPARSAARAGNVDRNLGEWVNVLDFDKNAAPGSTDMTKAIQAAINTGATVIVPSGVCLVTRQLTMGNPYQKLAGTGLSSEIRFALASPGIGIEITNSTGRHQIESLFLNGAKNVEKLVSVKAPQVRIIGNRLVNASSRGHVLFAEDEDAKKNIYAFGLILDRNFIYGTKVSGNYGVRLGLYSQTSILTKNVIENCGTLLKVEGATVNLVVKENTFERSTDYAIDINKSGSTPLMAGVVLHENYFEENQICIHTKGGEYKNLSVRNNYATRNTPKKAKSYFYLSDVGASAASDDIYIENNFIDGFDAALGLSDEYGSNVRGARGNTLSNTGVLATGAYAQKALSVAR